MAKPTKTETTITESPLMLATRRLEAARAAVNRTTAAREKAREEFQSALSYFKVEAGNFT